MACKRAPTVELAFFFRYWGEIPFAAIPARRSEPSCVCSWSDRFKSHALALVASPFCTTDTRHCDN